MQLLLSAENWHLGKTGEMLSFSFIGIPNAYMILKYCAWKQKYNGRAKRKKTNHFSQSYINGK